MIYELIGIARVPLTQHNREAADVVRHVGKLILNNRGVIRNVDNWGVRYLPKIWNKSRESHILGAHFYMKFDASPSVQREVQRALRSDARMLRSTIVKLGGEDLNSLLEPRSQGGGFHMPAVTAVPKTEAGLYIGRARGKTDERLTDVYWYSDTYVCADQLVNRWKDL